MIFLCVGTSTDVSRYAGQYEHVFETTTAGVTIQAPQVSEIINYSIGLDKQKIQRKIVNIFLPIIFSMCFGCSKKPSFEYPQHMFWLRSKKIIFLVRTLN